MTSVELIALISQKTGLKPNEVQRAIEAFVTTLARSLSEGQTVRLVGFGNFKKARFKSGFHLKAALKSVAAQSLAPIATSDTTPDVHIPYVDLSKIVVPKDTLSLIPEHIARRYQAIPIEVQGAVLVVAMIDPEDQEAIESIKKNTGKKIEPRICTQADLNHILDQYSAMAGEVEQIVKEGAEELVTEKEMRLKQPKKEELSEDAPAAKIVSSLLKRAVREKASDIHIEPEENQVTVRFRVDGILHKIINLPKEMQPALVSRIKIMANMKIDETRLPQDGRFQIILDRGRIDFRISTFPTVNGEKVVGRILDTTSGVLTLDQLGLEGGGADRVKEAISKSHGMTLVTGPTGSGKSTTLYAVVHEIMNEGVNIVTLEDPVEYRIATISQSQVRSEIGYTFASGLRSIVRQDPDIIMVGEIRDRESADLATHAALTGHIVLSSLHTNDAAGAIPRLIDMGIEPFLVSSSVNAVIAQRLCRKICEKCKQPKTVTSEEEAFIKKELATIPLSDKKRLEDITKGGALKLFEGKGCSECNNRGYKGRSGIFEVILVTDKIKELVVQKSSADVIKREAIAGGMTTMIQDGLIKTLQGKSTLEEVWHATKE